MHKCLSTIILLIVGIIFVNAENKRALLIGISNYPTYQGAEDISWSAIHGANDINLISNTLKKQKFLITTLLNKNATAKNIRKALSNLVKESKAGDLIYIHFSGHGQPYEDLSGDEDDGWDEAIIPYDALKQYKGGTYQGNNHILDDELEKYIISLRKKVGKAGYVYVVLDACHMGGASRGDEQEDEEIYIRGTNSGFSPNGKKYIPKIDKRGNLKITSAPALSDVCIVEACRAYQTNTEIKQGSSFYGPLTYYINQCLSNTTLNSNTNWLEKVRSLMNNDRRLTKQNLVIEKSN